MSNDRSAHHTIAGYHYQFDKSILEILRAEPQAVITLEGIEDVDVEGECIQCKYHAAQAYKRSLLKKPILGFLAHWLANGGTHRYRLYAHFKECATFTPVDVTELKTILGDDVGKLNIPESQLAAFVKSHFTCESGEDIETQRHQVLAELEAVLSATQADCEQYFYGNALYEVIRLSRQADANARTTTPRAFLQAIDKKRVLFSRWLLHLKGQRDYQRYIREQLRTIDALRSSKTRVLYLSGGCVEHVDLSDIASFCRALAENSFAFGKALSDAVPFTVILDRGPGDVRTVQQMLLQNGIRLNTGYESISFQPALFNELPIINRKSGPGGKSIDTISKASYQLRLIGAQTYRSHQASLFKPDTVIAVTDSSAPELENASGSDVFRISDCDTLQSLAAILCK